MSKSEGAEGKVREIRRKTRRKYSAEEKMGWTLLFGQL